MVTLPKLESYSSSEIAKLRRHFPTLDLYFQCLNAKNTPDPWDLLRIEKNQLWLQAAAASLLDKVSAEAVCKFWSMAAEQLLKKSWELEGLEELPVALFAFGKLGSFELNLSSDVDLVFIIEDDYQGDTTNVVKKLRHWIKKVVSKTEAGFLFRVDMDLRPGGSSSPLLPNAQQWINHYGYFGETWDRIAFVRFRGILGPQKILNEIKAFAVSYAFRKHLDYSLVPTLRDMQLKLRTSYRSDSFNLKYTPGTIRDLELFIHSIQIIYGGKNKLLQTHNISEALNEFSEAGIFEPQITNKLSAAYWNFRTIENYIQASCDRQTYEFSEIKDSPFFSENLEIKKMTDYAKLVNSTVANFIGEGNVPDENLIALGGDWDKLQSLKIPGRNSALYIKEKNKFLLKFKKILSVTTSDHKLAIQNLEEFIKGIKGKASFFSLLNRHETIIEELVKVFSFSPGLSRVLCTRPELLDSFIMKQTDSTLSHDTEELLQQLSDRKLLTELIASTHFLQSGNLDLFCTNLTNSADTIALDLLDHCFGKRSSSIDILALGKWGGQEMGILSDLDFIFLCNDEVKQQDSKSAKKFISLATSPGKAGRLFEIDLRLRPSGNSGPLLTSSKNLETFLRERAKPWQRQAYTKARSLKKTDLPKSLRNYCILKKGDNIELLDIRNQLINSSTKKIDVKFQSGALVETEFAVQIALMKHRQLPQLTSTSAMIKLISQIDPKWEKHQKSLLSNYSLLRECEQLIRICAARKTTVLSLNSDFLPRIAASRGVSLENYWDSLVKTTQSQAEILKSLDPLSVDS